MKVLFCTYRLILGICGKRDLIIRGFSGCRLIASLAFSWPMEKNGAKVLLAKDAKLLEQNGLEEIPDRGSELIIVVAVWIILGNRRIAGEVLFRNSDLVASADRSRGNPV